MAVTSLWSAGTAVHNAFGVVVEYAEHWVSGIALGVSVAAAPLQAVWHNNTGVDAVVRVTVQTHIKEVDIAQGTYLKIAPGVSRSGIEPPGVFSYLGAVATTNNGVGGKRWRPAPFVQEDFLIVPHGETLVYRVSLFVLENTGVATHVGLSYSTVVVRVFK